MLPKGDQKSHKLLTGIFLKFCKYLPQIFILLYVEFCIVTVKSSVIVNKKSENWCCGSGSKKLYWKQTKGVGLTNYEETVHSWAENCMHVGSAKMGQSEDLFYEGRRGDEARRVRRSQDEACDSTNVPKHNLAAASERWWLFRPGRSSRGHAAIKVTMQLSERESCTAHHEDTCRYTHSGHYKEFCHRYLEYRDGSLLDKWKVKI